MLKAYLRELPENILTKKLSPLFQNLFSNTELEIDLSSQVLINQVKELLDRLPNENYNLLALLSRHFERIVDNSPVNKMGILNLQVFTFNLGYFYIDVGDF